MEPKTPEPLLKTADVARELRVSESLLRHWRISPNPPLPCVRIGRLVRYRREDVNQFVAGRLAAA